MKNLKKNQHNKIVKILTLSLCSFGLFTQTAHAEGSRTLYPSGATGDRANLEWRTGSYANIVKRRTLLKVFANKDEYILMGSTANKVDSGDILIYNPGVVTGTLGNENIPFGSEAVKCSTQAGANTGKITSRAQELNGPQSADGTGNTSGYIPCVYKAPSTGIYDVVFLGPIGSNNDTNGTVPGDIALTNSNNFDSSQGSSIAAWDVTVRATVDSTTDINGRLFAYYLALFAGPVNGRNLYFPLYPITYDGYKYKVTLRGADPAGFMMYGNLVGFLDANNNPLYHDALGQTSSVDNPDGGVKVAPPQFPIFLNSIDSSVLSYIDRYNLNGSVDTTGIPISPILPSINNPQFTGTVAANNSNFGTGGNFTFNSGIAGVYQIVISKDGTNFDPTNTQNSVIRGVMPASGPQSVAWDGKDNSGNYFPVGQNYKFKISVHAGEYHFPFLDVENNPFGGPTIEMVNATNPLGNFTAFYDDRGYRTNNINVGTVGTVLCAGIGATPNPAFSDPINGFDSSTNARAYGVTTNNGNAGTKCAGSGSFGDTKGLDLWTYLPATSEEKSFNIISPPNLLLVKRVTRINTTDLTNIVDGRSDVATTDTNYVPSPRDVDDNDAKWPSSYIKGLINAGAVKPTDDLEYTIYFLSNGLSAANNVKFCDKLSSDVTFSSTAFNGLTPNDGVNGADQGIALAVGSTSPTVYFSNAADSDRGTFYPANDPATPAFCNGNPYGAIAIEITRNPVLPNLPAATGSGTPASSYGFVRFRVKVK